MRKWFRKPFVIVIIIVITIVGCWELCKPAEPSYEKKPLSFWLANYVPGTEGGPSQQEADKAMRAVGTNAIPTLLRLVQEKESPLKLKWYELLKWLDDQYAFKTKYSLAWERNYEGFAGFKALGADARVAVPDLIKIYDRNVSPDSRTAAIFSLGAIGPSANSAVPSLLKWLAAKPNDFDLLQALGEIHSDPDLVVPVLIAHLGDSQPIARQYAAKGLGAFGADAKPAVPALFETLKDEKDVVRRAARDALVKIDPEAASKARVN
jgi:HEAT repeat protein